MYEGHETFVEPNSDATVWRYMDFTKFVALLDVQSLWFSKPSLLGDPWELAYTRANRERFVQRFRGSDGMLDENALDIYRATLASMFVNCWHMGEVESSAMWRLYLNSLEGVAVQSTWGDLTASIGITRDPVVGGKVRYVDFADYETSATDDGLNMYFPTSTKGLSFSYEQEARLVYWWRPEGFTPVPQVIPEEPGFDVPWDIDRGIHRVVLCPGSSGWFKALVRQTASLYNLRAPIEDSSMDDEPTHL